MQPVILTFMKLHFKQGGIGPEGRKGGIGPIGDRGADGSVPRKYFRQIYMFRVWLVELVS